MKAPRRIVFPSEPACLAKVRDGVRDFLGGSGFGEEDEAKIIMALDEACTNIIRHAHEGLIKPVRLEMKWLRDRLRFVLRDYGKPFDPLTVQSRDLQIVIPGGDPREWRFFAVLFAARPATLKKEAAQQ